MLIESEYRFDAQPEVVFDGLMDPEILASALPGTDTLDITSEDRYEGQMEASVGPVTAARFDVAVEVKDKVRPERFDMHVDGKGKAGFVQGVANVALEEADGGTLMKYRADLQVGGRVASVGQRLLDSVGKSMAKQGLEAVNREINARLAPAEPAVVEASGASLTSSTSMPVAGRKRRLLLLALAIVAATLLLIAL